MLKGPGPAHTVSVRCATARGPGGPSDCETARRATPAVRSHIHDRRASAAVFLYPRAVLCASLSLPPNTFSFSLLSLPVHYRPVRPNWRTPVPVYQTARFGRKLVEVKFEFKILCTNGSYRYTDRFDRFTGRFDRFTGRSVGLTGNRANSIFFIFCLKFKCPQSILNECLYNMF